MSTAARCKSINITGSGVGASAMTAKRPLSAAPIFDDETVTKQYSDSRQKSIFGGSEVKGMTFTCADTDVFKAFKKNTRVASCIVVIEGALDADGTELETGDPITVTLNGGYIVDDPSSESSQDGGPMEYTFKVEVCRDAAGADGTCALT